MKSLAHFGNPSKMIIRPAQGKSAPTIPTRPEVISIKTAKLGQHSKYLRKNPEKAVSPENKNRTNHAKKHRSQQSSVCLSNISMSEQ